MDNDILIRIENGARSEMFEKIKEKKEYKGYTQSQINNEELEKVFGCNEEYKGISISKYLDKIRNKDKENVVLIAILDGCVKDDFVFEGEIDHVSLENYKEGAFDFIKKWYDIPSLTV